MESLFAFLFKYRPIVFTRGTLVFELPPPAVLTIAGLLGVAALAAYLRRDRGLRPLDRAVLVAFRGTAVLLLGFCLLRPVLVVATTRAPPELPCRPGGRLPEHADRRRGRRTPVRRCG